MELAGHQRNPNQIQLTLPIAPYPQKWNDIRLLIGSENDWVCQICGLELLYPGEKAPKAESYRRRANVHHRDRNKRNDDHSNLQLLCPKCHLNEHRGDRYQVPGQLCLPIQGLWNSKGLASATCK